VIVNSHGAYDAAGLPILAGAQSATANVVFSLSNTELVNVDFNLSSLTLAPEIDPALRIGISNACPVQGCPQPFVTSRLKCPVLL
jgi:hypothetical protein